MRRPDTARLGPFWNWKTALCSGLYRAPAFVGVSLRHGLPAAARAGAAEFLLFALICGLSGAAVERLRHLRPDWLARLIILGVIPASLHLCEFALHAALGTPARRSGLAVSLGLTVVSEAFSWYAMRQGALLTGGEGRRLSDDLRRMPALVRGFLLLPCSWRGHTQHRAVGS